MTRNARYKSGKKKGLLSNDEIAELREDFNIDMSDFDVLAALSDGEYEMIQRLRKDIPSKSIREQGEDILQQVVWPIMNEFGEQCFAKGYLSGREGL